MTAGHPLDGLISTMLPVATELAIAVHDQDAQAVADAVCPLLDSGDRDQIGALLVALAAMVPADMRIGDLLGWTHHPGADQLPYDPHAGDGEKRCRECERFLPLEAFHRDRSRADGRVYVCKQCLSDGRVRVQLSYRQARVEGLTAGLAVQEANTSINAARCAERARKAAA